MQSRSLHFDRSGLCERAADAFVSCAPRRAGSSCHSSRYSAHRRLGNNRPGTIARGYDDRRAFRWVGGANLRSHFLTDVQGRTTCRYVYLAYAVSYEWYILITSGLV